METLARLDQALIDAVEKALFAGRTKLGLSFPRAVSLCASMTVVMLAFSAFLSSGDLLTVKIPLLALYAVLALAMGKTLFRQLAYFDANWTSEIERGFAKSAMENRVKLRPVRTIRDVLSSLLGMPVLLTYQYIMCARPSGRGTV